MMPVRAGLITSILALVVGCATPPPPTSAPSAQPTAAIASATGGAAPPSPSPAASVRADEIVLRMSRSGGFLYPGTTIDEPPVFTLYGDGRVIYTIEVPLADGRVRRELRAARLTAPQVDALIENALDRAGLRAARERYADIPMADGSTTTFEVNAGGVLKTVSVYALGEYEEPGPDAAARAAFEALAQALRTFDAEVQGTAESLGPFVPTAYRVSIFPLAPGEFGPTAEWPWPHLAPADFEFDNSGFGRRLVAGPDGQVVMDLRPAEVGDPIVIGPDGELYLVRARALLPDEVTVPIPTPQPTAAAASSTEVALRLNVSEFPSPLTIIEPPEFTLYADGHAIYMVKTPGPDSIWPSFELHSAQLTPEQAADLITFALGEGGLRDARAKYDIPGGDMGMHLEWNRFELHAAGVDKEVEVYGLGYEGAPDAADRAQFDALAGRLLDFETDIVAARATPTGPFQPTAYDAFLYEGAATEELPVNADWPWPDLDVSDFIWTGALSCRVTAAEGEAVVALGIDQYLIAEARDGKPYLIRLRPLLPDEIAQPRPAPDRC